MIDELRELCQQHSALTGLQAPTLELLTATTGYESLGALAHNAPHKIPAAIEALKAALGPHYKPKAPAPVAAVAVGPLVGPKRKRGRPLKARADMLAA